MEILSNPDETMLVFIYEKEGGQITGVVMQAFSVYSAVGEMEAFVESLQREAIALSRHNGKKTIQFLALASKQSYSKAADEEVAKAVDLLLKELEQVGKRAGDIALSFELKLDPLGKSSHAVKKAFFSQPVLIPMLARESETRAVEKASVQKEGSGAGVMLGMTKEGKQVIESLQLFQRVLVSEGNEEHRNQFIQVLVESFLLANVPAVVFDQGNHFAGLSQPTKRVSELQNQGININPIGFPTKDFLAGKSVKVNLNMLEPAGFLNLFGCNDKQAEKVLKDALDKEKAESTAQLIRSVDSLKSENPFLKRRVERIVKLAETIYPEMFAGETNVKEMLKSWFEKIGRTSIVHVDELDPRALTFLMDSLTKELLQEVRSRGETGKPGLLVAIPYIEKVFLIRNNPIQAEFVKTVAEMKRFGVSFVAGIGKRNDMNKELLGISETKIGIIRQNDTAVDLPNSKNYRLMIRPTLSMTKEEQTRLNQVKAVKG
jgi:hypothetical protein